MTRIASQFDLKPDNMYLVYSVDPRSNISINTSHVYFVEYIIGMFMTTQVFHIHQHYAAYTTTMNVSKISMRSLLETRVKAGRTFIWEEDRKLKKTFKDIEIFKLTEDEINMHVVLENL